MKDIKMKEKASSSIRTLEHYIKKTDHQVKELEHDIKNLDKSFETGFVAYSGGVK